MGLWDRPYMKEPGGGMYGGGPVRRMSIGLPSAGRLVKMLLVINLVVYVFQVIFDQSETPFVPGPMSRALGVTVADFWQVHRYVTFQFLHDPTGFWHILLNMLGLYVLGSPLERRWGPRRFLAFYLSCGVFAGAAYVAIGHAFDLNRHMPIIGASGGVYGLILAAAVYCPHIQIIFLFFPVPIRLASIVIFGGMLLKVLSSVSRAAGGQQQAMHYAMSDVAHLGGAVMAAVWIWVLPGVLGLKRQAAARARRGAWERKLRKQQADEAEIDRILRKIHDEGIGSLSRKERDSLQDATRRQQEQDRHLHRL